MYPIESKRNKDDDSLLDDSLLDDSLLDDSR